MFDREIAERILQAVMIGMTPERAAIAHGITAAEHARWIERGSSAAEPTGSTELLHVDDEENMLAAYVRALDQAEAQAELLALSKVLDPRTDNPDANRWFLERRFAERWAKTPAAARAAQMQTPRANEATEADAADDGDELDDVTRRRQEKARAAGGAA